jgi:NAD(P)H-nitrite reductase large subunit
MIVCRCEEISREEIIAAIQSGARSIAAVKRRTSAGQGLCQGRICQRLIAQVLGEEGVSGIESIQPPTVRPPVRPIPMGAFKKRG